MSGSAPAISGLISAPDLRRLVEGNAELRICDVRLDLVDHDRARLAYDAGHLPGAVFVDLHSELAGGPGGGRHPLPDPADFVALLGRLGIDTDRAVVVYDDVGGAVASRLWWMLRSVGYQHVAVLDGGLAAWVAAGGQIDGDLVGEPDDGDLVGSESVGGERIAGRRRDGERGDSERVEIDTAVAPVAPVAPVVAWPATVSAADVAEAVAAGVTVIDARSPDRYRGDHEPIDAAAGHIPGAINIDHAATVGEDGQHLAPSSLAEMFSSVGPSPIVYCGSGVTACHLAFALSLVGRDDVRLYPGSWSEWSASGRPITTGPNP